MVHLARYCRWLLLGLLLIPSTSMAFLLDTEGGQWVQGSVSGETLTITYTDDNGVAHVETCNIVDCGLNKDLLAQRLQAEYGCSGSVFQQIKSLGGTCGPDEGCVNLTIDRYSNPTGTATLGCQQQRASNGLPFREVDCGWNAASYTDFTMFYRAAPGAPAFNFPNCTNDVSSVASRCYVEPWQEPPLICGYSEHYYLQTTANSSSCTTFSCEQSYQAFASAAASGAFGGYSRQMASLVNSLPADQQDVYYPFDLGLAPCPENYTHCTRDGSTYSETDATGTPTGNTSGGSTNDGGVDDGTGTGGSGSGSDGGDGSDPTDGGGDECDPTAQECNTGDGILSFPSLDFAPDEIPEDQIDIPALQTTGPASAAGSCPAPKVIPLIYGASATIDYTPLCNAAQFIRAFVLLFAAISAFKIGTGGRD